MSKKTNKKSRKITNILSPTFVLLILLSVAVIVLTMMTTTLWMEQNNIDLANLRSRIIEAVDDLSQKPQLDNNKAVIPEANLYLRYNQDLRYSGAEKTYIQFHSYDNLISAKSSLNVDSIDSLFGGVPTFQACSRQIIATTNNDSQTDYTLNGTKTLKDGRKFKIFTSNVCKKNIDKLLTTVKTLESY